MKKIPKLQEDIMKKISCLVFFAVAFVFFSCATKSNSTPEEGRYFEKSGGFSILIPESWQVAEMPSLKYKVIIGQTENDFTPNITFADEAFGGDLNFYVDASIEQFKKLLGENIEIMGRSDFVTIKNLKGVKLVTNSIQYDRHMRQIIYFFPGKGKKIVASCTVLAEAGETFDELFDKTMKTFEWTK
jgi:hypothetical protein